MKFEAELLVEFDSAEDARIAFESLLQETEFKKKSEAELKKDGKRLEVKIKADDLATLRAALNSYSRLLNVLISVKKIVK